MKKNLKNYFKDTNNIKYTILLVLFVVFIFPVNYYITIGGGTSNIDKRVEVEDAYKAKGSFNICYVSQLRGNVLTYLLSYVVPGWEREKYSEYKIQENETTNDIEYRDKMFLDYTNNNATYWANTLANKDVKLKKSHTYVIFTSDKYKNKLKIKDEIISIDDYKSNSLDAYSNYISSYNKGDKVSLNIIRNNKEKSFTSKVYEEDNKKIIGAGLIVINDYKTDKKIKYKFKRNESGPSGGLITTLDVYNKLVKKDITKGKKIAGTGTIEENGTIGEIDGIKYKLKGAVSGKADVFIVPEGNYKEASKLVRKNKYKIKVIKVQRIEDAINELNKL